MTLKLYIHPQMTSKIDPRTDLEEFLQADKCRGADVMGRPVSSLFFADDVMLLAYISVDSIMPLRALKLFQKPILL